MVAVNTTTGCSGLAAPSMDSSWTSPRPDLPWEEGCWGYRREGAPKGRRPGRRRSEGAPQGRRRGRRGGGLRRSRGAGRRRRERAGGARHCRSVLAANASRAGHGLASGLRVGAALGRRVPSLAGTPEKGVRVCGVCGPVGPAG